MLTLPFILTITSTGKTRSSCQEYAVKPSTSQKVFPAIAMSCQKEQGSTSYTLGVLLVLHHFFLQRGARVADVLGAPAPLLSAPPRSAAAVLPLCPHCRWRARS